MLFRSGGFLVTIHAQPGAKRTEVAGLHGDALKIRLAAPPVEGKANETLIAFVAGRLGLRRAEVQLVRGDTSRAKTLRVPCDPSALALPDKS